MVNNQRLRAGLRTLANVDELRGILNWRRRGDSNPRYGFRPYNGLANRRLQPLGHVSVFRTFSGGLSANSLLPVKGADLSHFTRECEPSVQIGFANPSRARRSLATHRVLRAGAPSRPKPILIRAIAAVLVVLAQLEPSQSACRCSALRLRVDRGQRQAAAS